MAKLPDGWVFTPKMKDMLTITVEEKELVRCRNCKFHDAGENECDAWNRCRLHSINTNDDEFCSWGVK